MKTSTLKFMLFMFAVSFLTLTSCSDDDSSPAKKTADVYVAGTYNDGNGHYLPAYWKNGEVVPLAETNGSADLIAVHDGDVYVLGALDDNSHTKRIWTNGVMTDFFTDDQDYAYFYNVRFFGDDMYVIGVISGSNGDRAAYWKNGVAHTLATTHDSRAYDIFVDGNDVYLAGMERDENGTAIAMVWKNDAGDELSDGSGNAIAFGIVKSGNDIYVSGDDQATLTLWKNGEGTPIGEAGNSGTGTGGLAIRKGDVYVSGYESNEAKIWVNGEMTSLTMPEGGTGSYAYNLAFFGKDVFVLGEAYVNGNYKAIVWKNGELFSPYDGTNNYSAYTMSVVAQQ